MSTLLKTFFRPGSHYSAVLPYNIAWQLPKSIIRTLKTFLAQEPIVVYDIGARDADLGEIANLRENLVYVAFDADRAEADRILAEKKSLFHHLKVFPYFVGEKPGKTLFHIYKSPGQSSVYAPAKRFKAHFGGDDFAIAQSLPVYCTTIDKIVKNEKCPYPDILKIDTQGSELGILKGAAKTLAQTLIVEIECEFIEMYEGQPLFHHICASLYAAGFELFYINRVFANRDGYSGEARGQITFCDALFIRREDKLAGISAERLARFGILLANYGHRDYAYSIWKNNSVVQKLIPGLNPIFKAMAYSKPRRLMRRIFLVWYNFFNKLLLLALYSRRSNKLSMDSDRSWPIR
jgi:FkbM family methyltransferase